jgi:hypothetical protein
VEVRGLRQGRVLRRRFTGEIGRRLMRGQQQHQRRRPPFRLCIRLRRERSRKNERPSKERGR